MKFLRQLIFSIISIVLFLLSIFVVLAGLMAADDQLTARIIYVITRIPNPLIFMLGGFILFIGSLYCYSRAGRSPDQTGTFTFQGEKGAINISLHALEDYITKHFAQKPLVHGVKVRVGTTRDAKKLRVRAFISVWSEQNLKTAGEAVQQEVVSCLKEGLGLDNVDAVLISVDKIIAAKSSKPISAE